MHVVNIILEQFTIPSSLPDFELEIDILPHLNMKEILLKTKMSLN